MDARLRRRDWAPSDGIAPHAARRALAQASGDHAHFSPAEVRTTLWAPLQRVASDLLTQQLRELHSQRVQDGAVIVLDNASGEVLAWVGSSGALSEAPEVDAVLAQRQAGSTLKPFLYAQAIAQRRLTAASLIEDAPTHIPTPSGLYIPQNYDRHFHGWVSVRTALASSLNTPAVRTLAMVSPNRFHQQLNAAGPGPARNRRLLRPGPGAGQPRGVAAAPEQRLPRAGQPGPLQRGGAAAAGTPSIRGDATA